MEAKKRSPTADLEEDLLKNGHRYRFFQAIYLLDKLCGSKSRIGGRGPFLKEKILFRANASLAFPKGDIERIEKVEYPDDAKMPPYNVIQNFLGIYGPSSPLPAFYTEDLLGKDDETNTPKHFLDMFHHRMVSFYYRYWLKYRYYLHFRPGGNDQFSQKVFSLVGLADKKKRENSNIDWERMLPVLGLLMSRGRSAELVEKIVSQYFYGIDVKLEQFVEGRFTIDYTQRNRLGLENCIIGDGALLGKRVLTRMSRFDIQLGTIDFKNYLDFLPGRKSYMALRELVPYLLKDEIYYQIRMKVSTAGVPLTSLGKENKYGLGWSAWLGRPKSDTIIVAQAGNS